MNITTTLDWVFPLTFVALFAWVIHADNYKGIRLLLMIICSVVFTIGALAALAGMAIFPQPFMIVGICLALLWTAGIQIKREPPKEKHPDWLIHKIEADLKTVELTKNPIAVEGYKKELFELLQKHNITPPPDIQKLLTPTTYRPRSSDAQQ